MRDILIDIGRSLDHHCSNVLFVLHLKLSLNIYDIVGSDGRPGSQGARGQPGAPGNNGNPGEKGKNIIEYNTYNRCYPERLVTMATL